jgi:hypothetical protein
MSLFNINADMAPLIKEIQAFKTSQQKQQTQIIALLQEQNQLLQQLLTKYGN